VARACHELIHKCRHDPVLVFGERRGALWLAPGRPATADITEEKLVQQELEKALPTIPSGETPVTSCMMRAPSRLTYTMRPSVENTAAASSMPSSKLESQWSRSRNLSRSADHAQSETITMSQSVASTPRCFGQLDDFSAKQLPLTAFDGRSVPR
jgi:hypothetical protein